MELIIKNLLISAIALAGEGSSHSHGDGGELEHLWIPLGFFVILIVVGVFFNFKSKKK